MRKNNKAMAFYSKSFVLLCLVILFYSSCKKEKIIATPIVIDTINDSISGILYRNCNLEPDSNRKVIVILSKSDYDVVWDEWTDTIFTDSMGRFKVVHTYTTNHTDDPFFFVLIPSCFGYSWPSASISPYQTFVTNDTMHAVIKLHVSNSLSSADTLYYQFGNASQNSLVGPFNNGILGTYDIPIQYGEAGLDSSRINLDWAIGHNNLFQNGGLSGKYKIVVHYPCTASDTVTIDLN